MGAMKAEATGRRAKRVATFMVLAVQKGQRQEPIIIILSRSHIGNKTHQPNIDRSGHFLTVAHRA
jgi:hypothetical protein